MPSTSACCWLDQVEIPPPSQAVHSLFISAREPNNWFWERRLAVWGLRRGVRSDSECCLEGLLLSYILTTGGGGCKLHYPHTRNTVSCLCNTGTLHTAQNTVVTVNNESLWHWSARHLIYTVCLCFVLFSQQEAITTLNSADLSCNANTLHLTVLNVT